MPPAWTCQYMRWDHAGGAARHGVHCDSAPALHNFSTVIIPCPGAGNLLAICGASWLGGPSVTRSTNQSQHDPCLSCRRQLKLDGAAADLLAPLKQLHRVSFPGGPYFESFSKRLAELLPPGRVGYDRAMRTSGRSTRDKALRQGRRR